MNILQTKIIESEKKMISFGEEISRKLNQGDIIFLNGEIGAGKTTLVKGIGKGLGIKELITSPTFTLIKEYDKILCHVDAYRLKSIEDIGIEDYKNQGYIICIEWGNNIPLIFDNYYIIDISYNEKGRKVEIFKKNEL